MRTGKKNKTSSLKITKRTKTSEEQGGGGGAQKFQVWAKETRATKQRILRWKIKSGDEIRRSRCGVRFGGRDCMLACGRAGEGCKVWMILYAIFFLFLFFYVIVREGKGVCQGECAFEGKCVCAPDDIPNLSHQSTSLHTAIVLSLCQKGLVVVWRECLWQTTVRGFRGRRGSCRE